LFEVVGAEREMRRYVHESFDLRGTFWAFGGGPGRAGCGSSRTATAEDWRCGENIFFGENAGMARRRS
jgi:hypothetical protein